VFFIYLVHEKPLCSHAFSLATGRGALHPGKVVSIDGELLLGALVAGLALFAQSQPGTASDALTRGKAELDARKYNLAEKDLAQAETDAPGKTNALALRAKALIQLERLPEAGECLETYLARNPSSPDATYLLAYVLFRENRPAQSLALYTQAARLQRPQSDDFKIVGLDYVLLNDYADATKWLERAVAEGPGNAEAVYYLGRAYYVRNLFDRAMSMFQRALKLDPSMAKAENNLGLCYEAKNNLSAAEAAYRSAIQLQNAGATPDRQPYMNLADLLRRGGRTSEALSLLDSADRIGGPDARSEEIRGRIFLEQHRLPQAEAQFRAAIASDPHNSSLHYLLGRVLKQEGRRQDAEREFAATRSLLGTHSSQNE
jgi:tetratricopeptide (TPR) repeat protein